MAESTLSIAYADLVRELQRLLRGDTGFYATGTIAISAGVVTLTGGTWPATWPARGSLNTGGTWYTVASRDSNTQLTLNDTSVTVSSGAAYVLIQASAFDTGVIEDAITAGIRGFLHPPPVGEDKGSHLWSFLYPTTTLAVVLDDYDYDLPDNFGQSIMRATYQAGAGSTKYPLTVVQEHEIRAMRAQSNTAGIPKYIAWRPKAHAPTTGQRFEALVYPKPNGSLTLELQYPVNHDKLTPANKYPPGGEVHSETILLSCKSQLAFRREGAENPYLAMFQTALVNSITLDRRQTRIETTSWPTGTVTYGTYEWLQREVGLSAGHGPNPDVWGHDKTQHVDSIIQRGIKQFYLPSMTEPGYVPHSWSFLRPTEELTTIAEYSTGTVTIVDGVVTLSGGTWPADAASGELLVSGISYAVDTRDSNTQLTLEDTTLDAAAGTSYTLAFPNYDLPADFGGFDGPLTYAAGNSQFYPPITVRRENDLRQARQVWNVTNRPHHAAYYPKTLSASSGTQWQITFYPTPDDAYLLTYRYLVDTNAITAGQRPYGGAKHANTILMSCLSVLDPRRRQEFLDLLKASIAADRHEMSPPNLGRMRETSDRGWPHWVRDSETIPVTVNGIAYD